MAAASYPKGSGRSVWTRNQARAERDRLHGIITDSGLVPNIALEDTKLVHHSGSNTLTTIETSPTTVQDGNYYDSSARPNKLRLTSGDLNATSIYSADGSGYLSKDGSTQSISLASSKTVTVGGITIVNSSAEVPIAVIPEAMKWRPIYASYVESDFACTVEATEKSTWTRAGDWFTIIFPTFERESAARDKYLRSVFEQRMDTASVNTCDCRVELDDGVGHTITGATVSQSGVTWVFKTQNVDISSLSTAVSITCKFRIRRSGGSDVAEVRRVRIEVGSA